MGRLCYPTQQRTGSWYFSRKMSRCKEGMARVFAVRVQILLSITRVAESGGTSLIGAGKLSRYRIFVGGTGAVSRYKLSRSQKSVTVQDLYCVQVSVSGCKMLNEFIWPAEQGMMIKDQKKKESSGPYSTSGFCSAGVHITRQKP